MESKLIRLLLLTAALLVELTIQEDQGVEERNPPVMRSGTLQLCGRNFIRAVIAVCGASRWKREAMGPAVSESVQTKDVENDKAQGDGSLDEDLSWSDFVEYYLDDQRNIPEDDVDRENDPKLKEYLRDRPSDTEPSWSDFVDFYGDVVDTVGGADDESGNESTGSDATNATVKRKRDSISDLHIKCCAEGCSSEELITFC